MQQLDHIVQRFKDKAKIAEQELECTKETLKQERELYTNIREAYKDSQRQLSHLKDAYNMQIDLVKALEARIDNLLNVT